MLNELSKHDGLNAMNLDLLLEAKVLQANQLNDFDFDNQFTSGKKYDSKKSYKMTDVYCTGLATIGWSIVCFLQWKRQQHCKI